jgi:hypothetical protein
MVVEGVAALAESGSSVRIRIEGVKVSSYWPERTAQMNMAKKIKATARLANINMSITDIRQKFDSQPLS